MQKLKKSPISSRHFENFSIFAPDSKACLPLSNVLTIKEHIS